MNRDIDKGISDTQMLHLESMDEELTAEDVRAEDIDNKPFLDGFQM